MKKEITFSFPAEAMQGATDIYLVGDFNNWNIEDAIKFEYALDGFFRAVAQLEEGQTYHYRFLLDNGRWVNDYEAQSYVLIPELYVDNCVIIVPGSATEENNDAKTAKPAAKKENKPAEDSKTKSAAKQKKSTDSEAKKASAESTSKKENADSNSKKAMAEPSPKKGSTEPAPKKATAKSESAKASGTKKTASKDVKSNTDEKKAVAPKEEKSEKDEKKKASKGKK